MRFSTKHLVLFGFALVLALVAGISYVGHKTVNDSGDGFGEYRDLARITQEIGDIEANYLQAVVQMDDFIQESSGGVEAVKKSEAYVRSSNFLKAAIDETKEALEIVADGMGKRRLVEIDGQLENYRDLNEQVYENILRMQELLANDVGPVVEKMMEQNRNLMSYAEQTHNENMVLAAADVYAEFLNLLIRVIQIIERYDVSLIPSAAGMTTNIHNSLEALTQHWLTTECRVHTRSYYKYF